MANAKKMGGRVFEIVTQVKHPETSEILYSEENTLDIMSKYKSIERYAIMVHDKDFLTKEEIKERYKADGVDVSEEQITSDWENKKYKRETHVHIVLETPNNWFPVDSIAKWFGVAPNFVRVKKGKGAFLDSVQYLTHEDTKQQDLGKFRYPDEEMISNFDWRGELQKLLEEKAKFGRHLSDRERLQIDILYNGMTLKQARLADPINYNKDLPILKRNRGDYLSWQLPPMFRLNLYICGSGGMGKDLMAKSIARSMYPDIDDDEIFFEINAKGVEFEGYDGQPVIIWPDSRAGELVGRWGRENLLAGILEPFQQSSKRQNIKYSSTSLVNAVNIFTGPDTWQEFLGGLVGEYTSRDGTVYKSENKAQSYRRFPLIIPVNQNDFDIMINNGFMLDNADWLQYSLYKNVAGNFARAAEVLASFPEQRKAIEGQLTIPIAEAVDKVKNKQEKLTENVEDILEEFKSYGTAKTGEQLEEEKRQEELEKEIAEHMAEEEKINEVLKEEYELEGQYNCFDNLEDFF